MRMKLSLVILLFATALIALPIDILAFAEKTAAERSASASELTVGSVFAATQPRRGRWGKKRNGQWYGYKNYGQYRRSRVGNRRYRLVRRPYWRNGIRLVRVVRVYY